MSGEQAKATSHRQAHARRWLLEPAQAARKRRRRPKTRSARNGAMPVSQFLAEAPVVFPTEQLAVRSRPIGVGAAPPVAVGAPPSEPEGLSPPTPPLFCSPSPLEPPVLAVPPEPSTDGSS